MHHPLTHAAKIVISSLAVIYLVLVGLALRSIWYFSQLDKAFSREQYCDCCPLGTWSDGQDHSPDCDFRPKS